MIPRNSFHEYSLFSASSADGLGNLPGRALFPRLISHLQAFTESGNKLYISHLHMSYKPFISIMSAFILVSSARETRLLSARS